MAKVFISHSWKDNEISRKIAHELRKIGVNIWIDYARIKGGDTLPERINQALEWCDTLILVWSKSAKDSFWVKKEWQSALTLQKEIIPCVIDDTPLPAILCSVLYVDFKDFDKGFEQLLRALDIKFVAPPPPPPKPPRPKIKIPIQKIMKIASIFLAIVTLGIAANAVVQKIASDRAAKRAYWEKWQTQMNARFQQAQQIDGDTRKSASEKLKIWQQFLTDFADDNPNSKQDNTQRQTATQRQNHWSSEQQREQEQARWAKFQDDMNRSYQQALQREKLTSLPAADKATMWQDFLDQYANNKDYQYRNEDNEKLASARQKKDYWLKEADKQSEQARWEQRQAAMTKSYDEAKRRDQNNSLSPDSKAQTWQRFLADYSEENPFSLQDNDQRQFANERITYWTNYKPPEPKPVAPSKQITIKGMTLVLIPGGTFDMGDDDEKPVHSVTVSDFYMSQTEVTNAQYANFLNDYGKDTDDQGNTMIYEHDWGLKKVGNRWQPQPGYENHPVINVTWYGAAQFAKWAGCRLPTEAEWEYAAREGGKKIKWSGTNDENFFGEYAWYRNNSGGTTHPVKTKKPNALGLYDMSGNVWEWCVDWYDENYYKNSPQNNPKGPVSGTRRVVRGGSWYDSELVLACSFRYGNYPGERLSDVGFRVACGAQS